MRFAVSDFADSFNSVRVSSTLAAATSGFGAAPLFPKKKRMVKFFISYQI